MALYKNAMEGILENLFDEIAGTLDCCTCEICRNDIIAYALNQLPSHYVVSTEGSLFSKMEALEFQNKADYMAALAQGVEMVKENPRH